MPMFKKRPLVIIGSAVLGFLSLSSWLSASAWAQGAEKPADWPTRPVTLIVPFAPGGPTDTVARLLAEQLRMIWQQPVIVDYKPGAGTVIGVNGYANGVDAFIGTGDTIVRDTNNSKVLDFSTTLLTGIAEIDAAVELAGRGREW